MRQCGFGYSENGCWTYCLKPAIHPSHNGDGTLSCEMHKDGRHDDKISYDKCTNCMQKMIQLSNVHTDKSFCSPKCYDLYIKKQPAVLHKDFLNKPYRLHWTETKSGNDVTCGIKFQKDGKNFYCNKKALFSGFRGYITCELHHKTECEEDVGQCKSKNVDAPVDKDLLEIGKTGPEYRKITLAKKMKNIMSYLLQRAENGHSDLVFPEPIDKDLIPVLKEKKIVVSEDFKTLSW